MEKKKYSMQTRSTPSPRQRGILLRNRRLSPAGGGWGWTKSDFVTFITLLLLTTTLIACSPNETTPSSANTEPQPLQQTNNTVLLTPAQMAQAKLKMGRLEKKDLGTSLKLNGMLELPPQSDIAISVPYGGFLKKTNMLPGSRVKKGALLAVIENPEFIQIQQDYLESLGRHSFLKSEYERQKELFEQQVASGKKYQQAQSDYQVNEARIKALEARLRLIGLSPKWVAEGNISSSVNVYSPITGAVKDVHISVGKYVNPTDVIMSIANTQHMHAELKVYESDLDKLQIGQKLDFYLAANPTVARKAEVYLIGAEVQEDRSVTIHAHLEKEDDPALLPGMYISAAVHTSPQQTPALPEDALVRYQGRYFVFVSAGERQEADGGVRVFEMVKVERGATEHGYSAVTLPPDRNWEEVEFVVEGGYTLLATIANVGEGE